MSLKSRGQSLAQKQANIPWPVRDYSYIDFCRKAYENETKPAQKIDRLHLLREREANRDFRTGSIRQINHWLDSDLIPRGVR